VYENAAQPTFWLTADVWSLLKAKEQNLGFPLKWSVLQVVSRRWRWNKRSKLQRNMPRCVDTECITAGQWWVSVPFWESRMPKDVMD